MNAAELLSDDTLARFHEGTHARLYEALGAKPAEVEGEKGVRFAVWAPHAEQVSLIGQFNNWSKLSHPLQRRDEQGIWEGFVPGLASGAMYKYHIASPRRAYAADKADPLALASEAPPETASVVWQADYAWGDAAWMARRDDRSPLDAPLSIYELHLGSWMRGPKGQWLSYRELAPRLADYVHRMGFTHVELLPIQEHIDERSCGFRTTGFFAPTARYGAPQDLMYLVDYLHQQEIGVLFAWAASRFSDEGHGLVYFDGTHLYEPEDPDQAWYPDVGAVKFDLAKPEVRSFLLSNACYWFDRYHVDGLRLDAVSAMLYRDKAAFHEGWNYRRDVALESVDAVAFLKQLNEHVEACFPNTLMIADETSAWPLVAAPAGVGGLGFDLKWNTSSVRSVVSYLEQEPFQRERRHREMASADVPSECCVSPLSHAETGPDKGSLLDRMPGDEWQKFANLRLLLGYLYAQRGKKLVFMGMEFAERSAWNCNQALAWELAELPPHRGLQQWVIDLNAHYKKHEALFDLTSGGEGFEWIDRHDDVNCIVSFVRRSRRADEQLLVAANFLPVPRINYRLGVPQPGVWKEILNSDARHYGGSGYGNLGAVESAPIPYNDRPQSVNLTLPPLAILFFQHVAEEDSPSG